MNAKDQDGLTALDYTQSRGFMPFMALQTPQFKEEAALLRELGATVLMPKDPQWPVLGPPQGMWPDIWPLGEPVESSADLHALGPAASRRAFAARTSRRRRRRARRCVVPVGSRCGRRRRLHKSPRPISAALFLLQGAGCNVLALRGDDGALMIDGGLAANAEALLRAVKAATGNDRIHTLINTHWHPEQTGANELVGRAGGVIFAHEKTRDVPRAIACRPVTFEGRREPLPEVGAADRDDARAKARCEFAGQQDRLRLSARGAHGRRSLRARSAAERAWPSAASCAAEAWPLLDYRNGAWLGGRVRASNGSRAWSSPTRASCRRMARC